MKPSSQINSPIIDLEAFFDGLSWDNADEIPVNLGALESGVRFLRESILGKLVTPESIDFTTLTRTLQDSDPMFKICKGLESFIAVQSGESSRFKEVADDLRLIREIIAGLIKYPSGEIGHKAREEAFSSYLELLPKIHTHFIVTEDALLRWKASVMLEQQIDFVGSLLDEDINIAQPDAILTWGNDYLKAILPEGESSNFSEIAPLLANLKSHCLQLLQSEVKQEAEYYDDTIVLTPAAPGHALSGFSELIFRAKKEAEKGAKFTLTLDFEAVPVAENSGQNSGPLIPVQPVHLKRTFLTPYVEMEDIREFIDGYASSLRQEVSDGVFNGQDSKSLKEWFTDSIIPWVQKDEIVLIEN
ncbi:MAG: hypothetical protein R3F19_17460 [Verrucomicrobiales bacterium]